MFELAMQRREFLSRAARNAVALGVFHRLPLRLSAGVSHLIPSFTSIRDRYFLQFLRLNPVVSTYLGGDGYHHSLSLTNGKLRDYRPDALAQERQFYRTTRDQLGGIDVQSLSPTDRIDHDVLQAQLGFLLHQLEDTRPYERAIDTYVAEPFRGIDWQLQQMQRLSGEELGTADEWSLVVARLLSVPGYRTLRDRISRPVNGGGICRTGEWSSGMESKDPRRMWTISAPP